MQSNTPDLTAVVFTPEELAKSEYLEHIRALLVQLEQDADPIERASRKKIGIDTEVPPYSLGSADFEEWLSVGMVLTLLQNNVPVAMAYYDTPPVDEPSTDVPEVGKPSRNPMLYLHWFVVSKAHRNQGIGSALLQQLMSMHTGHELNVSTCFTNWAAVAFYKKNGLIPTYVTLERFIK